jgi:hypothetical protein
MRYITLLALGMVFSTAFYGGLLYLLAVALAFGGW